MQKYQDSSLSPEERAGDLLARMNLDEKFGQIQCYNAIDSFLGKSVEKQNPYGVGQVCILIATMLDDVGSVAGLIARLQKQIMESGKHHIPAIFHIETLTGVMVTAATSFPCGVGQASTWDPEQQQKMAACIARQGRAMGISHALAPVFDICRDPRFGRMGETYGEDPTLAAAMGTAYVKGLQDKHRMSACSKHFLGFMAGQGGIHTARAVVSPRELREVYAKPFQAAITEGKLDSVMNSYAAIDGQVPAGSKAILRDLLRGEMGFNGVTVSDCDEVGLYVMDEAFDYWYRMKSPNSPYNRYFMQDFKVDTAVMVQDAYNHPSVVIYSIGNEIPEAGGVKGVLVGKEIGDAIHALDTTRPTTLCPSVHWLREYLDGTPYLTTDEDEWMRDDPERQKADWMHYASIFRGAVNNLPDNEKGQAYPETYIRMDEDATKNLYPYLDIAGYNYYEDRYEVLHKLHPERVLLGTETRHTMLPDTMKFAKTHPYLIGDFVWTLQSHLGEINCCDLHYEENEEHKSYPWVTNHGGVLDLTGQAEPSLHRYEFIWGGFLDKPVHALYLASQPPVHNGKPPIATSYRWTDTVDGWTYEGYEGKRTFVDAYTDADSVEIFVNGKSAGKAQVKDYFAKIPCIYEPGELVGVGYDADGQEIYRTSVRTADAETMLTVKTDKNILRAGGQDFCFADVYVTDKNGTVKLLPDYDVKIEVVGAASLQGYGSAAYKNAEHYDQHHHKSWQGHLQAVLRSTEKTGPVTVTFTADGCAPAILHLSAE